MTDAKDQLITSRDPAIEADAIAAAKFVAAALAACILFGPYVFVFWAFGGVPGVFFATITGVAAFAAIMTTFSGPISKGGKP